MSEQYLVDTHGNTIGIVVDPDTYKELVQAREELDRMRAAQNTNATAIDPSQRHHSIHELRGLAKEVWAGIDAQKYISEERDAWDG